MTLVKGMGGVQESLGVLQGLVEAHGEYGF